MVELEVDPFLPIGSWSIFTGDFFFQGVQLGGGFKHVLFLPLLGEMIQFDEHIFQMGWFNHQLDNKKMMVCTIELLKMAVRLGTPF